MVEDSPANIGDIHADEVDRWVAGLERPLTDRERDFIDTVRDGLASAEANQVHTHAQVLAIRTTQRRRHLEHGGSLHLR